MSFLFTCMKQITAVSGKMTDVGHIKTPRRRFLNWLLMEGKKKVRFFVTKWVGGKKRYKVLYFLLCNNLIIYIFSGIFNFPDKPFFFIQLQASVVVGGIIMLVYWMFLLASCMVSVRPVDFHYIAVWYKNASNYSNICAYWVWTLLSTPFKVITYKYI